MPEARAGIETDSDRALSTATAADEDQVTPETDLGTLIEWFETAEDLTTDARELSERDRDYYDGKQWTDKEKKVLRERKQPDTVNNELQRKIDFLTGFEAEQRTDPKAFPRNPNDEETAEAATDMLRYQETASELDQKLSDVWENMMIEGFGGLEVRGPEESNPNVIEVIHWHWDRLFYDPHSRRHDFSDARYFGGVLWMDDDQAKARWPNAEDMITSTVAEAPVSNAETYMDRPRYNQWAVRGARHRIRIVQIYFMEGNEWWQAIYSKGGIISAEKIEFLNEDGEPDCPMILQSCYVDRENNRYGLARQLIGPQDEINKRASKALHLISTTGGMYEEGAIDNIEEFATTMAKADGWGKVNAGMLDRIEPRDNAKLAEASSNVQLLREAKEAIQQKGPNQALQGQTGSSASGRAIRANQEGGIIEIARPRDRFRHFKTRVYRAIWNRVRQFTTEETWIRVTDNENHVKFVGFNRQVTFAEIAAKELDAGS